MTLYLSVSGGCADTKHCARARAATHARYVGGAQWRHVYRSTLARNPRLL